MSHERCTDLVRREQVFRFQATVHTIAVGYLFCISVVALGLREQHWSSSLDARFPRALLRLTA
jgi:hypothetical protein